MQETAQKQIQAFPGQGQLAAFAGRLLEWLNRDLNPAGEPLTESRARALLLAANVIDEPTRNSFVQIVETEQGMRLALYDLLRESGLAENEEIAALAAASVGTGGSSVAPDWLALAVAAHAWRSDMPLDRLDPASPPDPYSPAGQVLRRAANFVRLEVQRSATERDKLGRKLAHAAGGSPSLDALRPDAPIPPLPPYFRPPVPERYPEYTPGIQIAPDDTEQSPAVSRESGITISDDDLSPGAPRPSMPIVQPPLRIDASQLEPPAPPSPQPPTPRPPAAHPTNVVIPNATTAANTAGARSAARRMGRGRVEMKATKLHIVVQERPDGPGLYGLQVRVSSRGIRRYVAGTTNQDGEFTCELPVQLNAGLTYDVDVTWPRDYGGDVERKSITLNADRTHFTLPFYRTLKG
jgi:hypothetical protein